MPTNIRSHSQVGEYERCPLAFKKTRIDKEWQEPAAWYGHGTAVHTGCEARNRDPLLPVEEAVKIGLEEYDNETNRYLAETPNTDFWAASGPYGGDEDIRRRYALVEDMIRKYYDYLDSAPDEVLWVSEDGTPGIELPFLFDLEGVKVRGFIDVVLEDRIRDIKTGQVPKGKDQLKLYQVAMAEQFGHEVRYGDYWLGKTGNRHPVRQPYDLDKISRQEVVDRFHEADEGIRAERFDPKPSRENCRRCNVRHGCPFRADV